MHYQLNPTDETPENVQKPLFWHFGSFKNAFLRFLNDPSWPGNVAKRWKTFTTIIICNIKSIQQTKHQNMAKNLYYGSLNHSKMHFCDFWMIQHERYHSQMLRNILYYHNMRYEVNLMHQSWKSCQKPHFCLFFA